MKTRHKGTQSSRDRSIKRRRRTDVEGQNPQANDSPEIDVYHDENRRNMFDPEVAKSLKGPSGGRRSNK